MASFQEVFSALKPILKRYESSLIVKTDTDDEYYLDAPYIERFKREVFFGAVQIKKNYVSFHLMPIYIYPRLLKEISPELKKHMQGKSCFNFKSVDEELFKELEELVAKGYALLQMEY